MVVALKRSVGVLSHSHAGLALPRCDVLLLEHPDPTLEVATVAAVVWLIAKTTSAIKDGLAIFMELATIGSVQDLTERDLGWGIVGIVLTHITPGLMRRRTEQRLYEGRQSR